MNKDISKINLSLVKKRLSEVPTRKIIVGLFSLNVIGKYDHEQFNKLSRKHEIDRWSDYLRYIETKDGNWVALVDAHARITSEVIHSGAEYVQEDDKYIYIRYTTDSNFEFKIRKEDIRYDAILAAEYRQHGCFVATACAEHKGLSDNCFELETLRGLRDNFMLKTREGIELVNEYYQKAPFLVELVKNHPKSSQLFSWSFEKINQAVELTTQGRYGAAVNHYKRTVLELENLVQK